MTEVSFKEKAFALLRTNTALVLLCIISVGVLYMVFRPSNVTQEAGETKSFVVAGTASQPVRHASVNLKDMPATSTYYSFAYTQGMNLPVDGTCRDAYRVIMIFPATIDYRQDPLAAKYNTAEECQKGKPYSVTLDLSPFHLTPGDMYYLIHADEGTGDSWTDPR